MNKMKNVNVKGLNNTRDISEISSISKIKIKKNVLFRSGRIDKIKEDVRNKFLKDHNIKLIIDLRNEVEIEEGGSLSFNDDVKYYHVPILTKEFFGITHEKKMSKAISKNSVERVKTLKEDMYLVEMYKDIVFNSESIEHFKTFFRLIIDNNEGAILYNCTTGKDRTGIASMFILSILGVEEEAILFDYMISQKFNRFYVKSRRFLLSIAFFAKRSLRKLLRQMLGAKEIYMKKTIDEIKLKYGSLINYLHVVLNLSDNDIDIIRSKLLINNNKH